MTLLLLSFVCVCFRADTVRYALDILSILTVIPKTQVLLSENVAVLDESGSSISTVGERCSPDTRGRRACAIYSTIYIAANRLKASAWIICRLTTQTFQVEIVRYRLKMNLYWPILSYFPNLKVTLHCAFVSFIRFKAIKSIKW